jgi:spore germination cell wall hydrolase CwlJ-like protein
MRLKRTLADWMWLLAILIVYILTALVIATVIARAGSLPGMTARLQRGELEILARVVQAEATGEPAAGQRAVAWTIVNRMKRPDVYGKTLTRVILAPYQYAKPVPLNDNSEDYLRALLASVEVLLGTSPDTSNGGTHFFRCDMARPPRWAMRFKRTARIGRHCFFEGE